MNETTEFLFKGKNCTLIRPEKALDGRPWVWRTEFLYAFNDADIALLKLGYHVAYCSYSDEYGSDRSVEMFRKFHDFLTAEYGLARKASLFGFSRGALYACNYAMKYPEDCACLYLDAPVIDLRSWPGGFGRGCGSPEEWEDCKKRVLGVSGDEEAKKLDCCPADRLDRLVAAALPVMIVAGDSDRVVPYEENGLLLENAYKKAGLEIPVFIKKGCDHHPHSLEDVSPIVRFVNKSNRI